MLFIIFQSTLSICSQSIDFKGVSNGVEEASLEGLSFKYFILFTRPSIFVFKLSNSFLKIFAWTPSLADLMGG